MIRHEGRFPARLANDLRAFYAGVDNLWAPVSIVGASAPMRGQTDGWTSGPTSFVCDTGSRRAGSWGLGGAIDLSVFYRDQGTLPFWQDGVYYITGEAPFTAADRDALTACGMGSYDQTGLVSPTIRIQEVQPYGNGGASSYFVGQLGAPNTTIIQGEFILDGIGFGLGELLKRMKGLGATCVEAWAEVQFDNMGASYWQLTRSAEWNAFAGTFYQLRERTFVKNGVVVESQIYDAAGNLTYDESNADPGLSSVGVVSLVLAGIEEDSADIIDVNGNPQSVPDNNFVALASTSASVTAGEWTQVNVTGLINALLNDTSRSSSYILIPSAGALPGDLTGLAALAESTRPAIVSNSASYDATEQRWLHTYSVVGSGFSFDGFAIGTILARFRLPSGILEDIPGPLLIQPPRTV